MGFIKRNDQRKEETDAAEKKEYPFPEDAELKACRYCQTMIPKTARICPNCRKRLKKNWLGIFLCICLLAACAAGVYYYAVVYSVTGSVEVVQSEEAVQDAEAERMPKEGIAAENEPAAGGESIEENMTGIDGAETDTAVQIENLPEIPTALGGPADSETEKNDGLMADIETEEEAEMKAESGKGGEPEKESEPERDGEAESGSEPEKDGEAWNGSEPEKDGGAESGSGLEKDGEAESSFGLEKGNESGKDDKTMTERGAESEEAAEEKDRAGMMADNGVDDELDTESESGENLTDGTVKITDMSEYTEEEFRDICKRVDYKKLLRRQELYLNAAVTEELTVIEQVDGGLFDENIYYLCEKEDEQGITRYYIIRDDRGEDAEPILEGDVLRVYGQLFGSCKLPGYLNRTRPVVPALTMKYYDLLEE